MTTNLLALEVHNYKALTLFRADFSPAGGVVRLAGKNGSGKTSAIDALESLLAGRKQPPVSQPVHAGAMEARVIGTFDDMTLTRVWKNGGTSITAKSSDGRTLTSEKAVEGLYSIGLDPFRFSQMTPADQVALLLPLIGYDPAKDDAEYAEAYELRTVAGRRKDQLKAQLDGYPMPAPGTPEEEVSATALMAELDAANQKNREADKLADAIDATEYEIQNAKVKLEATETELAEVEERASKLRASIKEQNEAIAFKIERLSDGKRAAATAERVDVEPLRARIAGVDETNAAVRSKLARRKIEEDLIAAVREHGDLEARVAKTKQNKVEALSKAKMPVPNLSIDPESNTLMLDGAAFADAGSGEKALAGLVIAMALNPGFKLITVRDSSLLDDENQAVIERLAADNGFLILMEVVGDGADVDGAVLVISEGEIVEARK